MLVLIGQLARRVWAFLQEGWVWLRRAILRLRDGLLGTLFPADLPATAKPENPAPKPVPKRPPSASPASTTEKSPASTTEKSPASTTEKSPAASPASATEKSPAASSASATAPDDETALARMLASEGTTRDAKLVTGWIAVQRQRARKTTLYQMLTRGQGYGPQQRASAPQDTFYASTVMSPTASDRTLARGILNGSLLPSAAIRAHKPGHWLVRGAALPDDKIVLRQFESKAGIFGRVAGTPVLLLSPDASKIDVKPGQTAKQVLDAVPEIPATDAA